jgi:hypothetical protein
VLFDVCRLFIYFIVVVPRELILAVVVIPITYRLLKYVSGGSKFERLGDPLAIPTSQYFRIFARECPTRDLETFIKLARGYVFQGTY